MTPNDVVLVVQTYGGRKELQAGPVPCDSAFMKDTGKVSDRV